MKTASGHLPVRPQTAAGSWSVWLEFAFVLMFVANILYNIHVIQPGAGPHPAFYGTFILFMLLCGVAGGIMGLIAVTKQYERSLSVWLSTPVGIFALLIFLNESMQGIRYLLGI